MAGNEFSKKMCHELLVLEDYLMNCKTAAFQKDKIIVDKYKILEIVTSLRSYHCADRSEGVETKKEVQAQGEVQTFVINKEKPIKKEEPNERNIHTTKPLEQENPLKGQEELDRYIEKKRAEALKALEEEMAQRREEEEQKLLNRVKNAQMIADQSLEKVKAGHAENASMIVAEAENKAKQIISEAKINADYMVSQAETKAHVKQEEMDALLAEKVAAAEKQAEEIIARAKSEAEMILEHNTKQAADITLAGYKRAEGLIDQAEEIYRQHLGVIKSDKEAIQNILKKLDEME